MTREEHLEWAKERAREYLDKGELGNAWASFISDVEKHPNLHYDQFLMSMGMRYVMANDYLGVRRFIEGFN